MSERQIDKLTRTYLVCVIVALTATSAMAFISLDVVFWQTPFISWITYENYLPVIRGLFAVSLPFWVVGVMADIKLTNDRKTKESI